MKFMIIDRDALSCQLLQKRLEERSYDITCEPDKSAALDLLKNAPHDVILFDPAPIQDARAIIINIYKTIQGRYEPQFLLLSKTMTQEDALNAGANDLIAKPVSPQDLNEKLDNLERIISYLARLRNAKDQSPQRGVINKSAFHELFLSAIDRAHRYGERSYTVFINITGNASACDTLGARLRFMRRQSDVIGQIGPCEFGILLQRPLYETEPYDAITRFSEVLGGYVNELEEAADIKIDLQLIEIPIGTCHIHTEVATTGTTVLKKPANPGT